VGDFANKNIFDVIDNFGNYGIELWKIARGIDYSDFQVGGLEKSISREETFEYDLTDRKSLVEIVDQLAKQLTVDLGQTMFKTISIKVRYADFTTISKSTSTKFPSTNTDLIKELALQLLDEHVDYNRPVRLCGIKISNLEHSQAKQLSLCTFLVAPV
jgi:DNA polymerase-4